MGTASFIISIIAIIAALFFYVKSSNSKLTADCIKELIETKLNSFAQEQVKELVIDIVKSSIESGSTTDDIKAIIEEKFKGFAQDDVKQLIISMLNEAISEKHLVSQGTVAEMISDPEVFGITRR